MRDKIRQFRAAFEMTRENDPRLVPYMAAFGGGTFLVVLVLGVILGNPIIYGVMGLLLGLLAALSVLGRRAQAAQFASIEGRPGAAAAVLNVMRGQWFVTPAVAVTRKQELVHRVVGRCGVVLVGEGGSARVKQLLGQERKRHQRAAGEDIPVHTVIVGEREDEVALAKLQMHVQKLSRSLGKREVPRLDRKLGALNKANIPMPQGYMPRPGKKMR